jgi:hypothetical protein
MNITSSEKKPYRNKLTGKFEIISLLMRKEEESQPRRFQMEIFSVKKSTHQFPNKHINFESLIFKRWTTIVLRSLVCNFKMVSLSKHIIQIELNF